MKAFLRAFGFLSFMFLLAQSVPAGDAITNLSPAVVAALSNQVAQLESEWNAAHLANDAPAVEKLCADDLTVIVPSMPPINKAGAVAALRSGRLKFVQFETSEVLLRAATADTAIVTGRLQRARETGGQLITDDLRFTKVWVRRAGQWRVTAFHASPYSP